MQLQNKEECLDAFIEKCREHNLKITPQRCAIYKEIFNSEEHPSAEAVYNAIHKEYPNISYDTVNRTLLTFADIGIVDIVRGQSGPRRFDPNTDSHHHVYCVNCGEVFDFYNEDYDNLKIPDDLQQKFDTIGKRVILNGICKQCKESKS